MLHFTICCAIWFPWQHWGLQCPIGAFKRVPSSDHMSNRHIKSTLLSTTPETERTGLEQQKRQNIPLAGPRGTRTPPVQILSFSCIFRQKPCQNQGLAPPPSVKEILDPPLYSETAWLFFTFSISVSWSSFWQHLLTSCRSRISQTGGVNRWKSIILQEFCQKLH